LSLGQGIWGRGYINCYLNLIFLVTSFFFFFQPLPRHMDVPWSETESELELQPKLQLWQGIQPASPQQPKPLQSDSLFFFFSF